MDLFGWKSKLEEEFEAFDRQNPWVYGRLLELCYLLRQKGFKKYSTRTLISVLRYEWDLKTGGSNVIVAGGEQRRVKLNDHHSPYYARKIIRDHPEFKGFFELRSLGKDR